MERSIVGVITCLGLTDSGETSLADFSMAQGYPS